ncbi:L-2-hydroxyglutarate oxidase [Spongiibacter taiwanensis]|uniref:L-2-hydroxyglutarate oxidase n=1 Tax=Spongiibacter taiwanensis TaxID=1748242 RepID=UPI002035065B|nr:L-2-hydroxyglutarate oxidase [Spongiibacter taiwanensis]USA44094.1 L-2-hydroxyglutarate oxidase [Spongiibacter taiwanensis]
MGVAPVLSDKLEHVDAIIIGAGIVGAATAWHLQQQRPHWRIVILEKESDPAQHQSGHNSGVVHAGVYYAPGSLKARFCREGLAKTLAFCDEHDIKYRQCGKLIVARDQSQLATLESLRQRALENGLQVSGLSGAALREREPRLVGSAAIHVADTAVVDYRQVTRKLLSLFEQAGGSVRCGEKVVVLDEDARGVSVETTVASLRCDRLINCAGLAADRLVRLMGLPCDFQIIPFRGEFYRLGARCSNWLNHLVYPVPNPALPFLGVHLTLTVGGDITAGPNAVLAWAREGYHRGDADLGDIVDMMRFRGFWRLLWQHWPAGIQEILNSYSRRRYALQLQGYCPDIMPEDLHPHPAGVRAQAVTLGGELMHDFHFVRSPRSLHVGNAPSPAATSALPIGAHISAQILAQ